MHGGYEMSASPHSATDADETGAAGQSSLPERPLLVGRIGGSYGVRGWVRVHCFMEDPSALQVLPRLWLKGARHCAPVEVCELRRHGKGYVAHLAGIEDRDQADRLRGAELLAEETALPAPPPGEYYWRQLEGLEVWCHDLGQDGGRDAADEDEPDSDQIASNAVLIGRVHHLLETGANDVLVVRPCEGSIDERERLLPYLPEAVVQCVDLESGRMMVRWYLDA